MQISKKSPSLLYADQRSALGHKAPNANEVGIMPKGINADQRSALGHKAPNANELGINADLRSALGSIGLMPYRYNP